MALLESDIQNLLPLFCNTCTHLNYRTILITGSSGLIGGYLLDSILCIADHFDLTANLILTTRSLIIPPAFKRNQLSISYIYCDFDDISSVEHVSIQLHSSIDIFFHCASPSTPNQYTSHPFTTFASNSTSLSSLLKTLNHASIGLPPKFFYFSTTGVYGTHPSHEYPLTESCQSIVSPTDLRSIYNISKIAGEQLLSQAAHKSNLCLYILRLNINYGPGINLSDGRALSDFLLDAISGQPIRLRSLGRQTRNYLYLSDTISAIFMLLNHVHTSCTVNISHHEDTSVRELASLISKIFSVDISLPECPQAHVGIDFDRTSVDCSKLYRLTGWYPKVSLQQGLHRLVLSLDSL